MKRSRPIRQAIWRSVHQIRPRDGCPLELHVPNQLTAEVLRRAEAGEDLEYVDCVAKLFES